VRECWGFIFSVKEKIRSATEKEGTQRDNRINGFNVKKECPTFEIVATENRRLLKKVALKTR